MNKREREPHYSKRQKLRFKSRRGVKSRASAARSEVMEALLWVMGHTGLPHSITCLSPRHFHLLSTPHSAEETEKLQCCDSTTCAPSSSWAVRSYNVLIQYHLNPSAALHAVSRALSFISYLSDRCRRVHTTALCCSGQVRGNTHTHTSL